MDDNATPALGDPIAYVMPDGSGYVPGRYLGELPGDRHGVQLEDSTEMIVRRKEFVLAKT